MLAEASAADSAAARDQRAADRLAAEVNDDTSAAPIAPRTTTDPLKGIHMPVNSIARTVLRFQYAVARSPLTALDARVLTRLPDSSRVKITLTRGLAALDAAVGRAINDPKLERRGEAVAQRFDKTEQAARSAATADSLRAQAEQTKQTAADQAAKRRKDAARVERERIADALREESEAQQHAGELADASAAEQKRQADLRAKHQQAEQAEQRRAKERRIAAAKARKTAPAKSQLEGGRTDEDRRTVTPSQGRQARPTDRHGEGNPPCQHDLVAASGTDGYIGARGK